MTLRLREKLFGATPEKEWLHLIGYLEPPVAPDSQSISGTVLTNNTLFAGTVLVGSGQHLSNILTGHASRCCHSELGAGVLYNREKNESLACSPPPPFTYIPLC